MNKTTCLIHRQPAKSPLSWGDSLGRTAFGRRFLPAPVAVLAALTLSATLLPAPSWAAEEANPPKAETSSKPRAAVLPLGELKVGKSMQLPMSKGAKYEVQDGSAQVRMEAGDGYLLITPLEPGSVSFTMNGMAYGVKVVAAAQTVPAPNAPETGNPPAATAPGGSVPAATAPGGSVPAATAPGGGVPAATAPSTGTDGVPTLVPVAPAPNTAGPDTSLPALTTPGTTPDSLTSTPNGVPSGMAPVSPPQVSAPLPPPSRMPNTPAFPTRSGMPRNMRTSGVPIRTVNVTKGLASLLSFQRNILSVYFSDATVMDARAINARTLAVTGGGVGKSTLAVFTATSTDDTVGQLNMFHVVVDPPNAGTPLPDRVDPLSVETAIRTAINDPRVQVSAFSTSDGGIAVRLNGRVREAVEAKAAEETAALYASKVINGLVVDKDAPSYDQAFLPQQAALTPEEVAQNQLRAITGNQTVTFTPLGGSWVLRGEVGSQAEAQQLLTLANTLNDQIVPLLVVRGPNGFTPAETPISSVEDREMTRRLQEVTGLTTVYALRSASNGIAVYGSVRNRAEFDRVQRYKDILPVVLQGVAAQAGQNANQAQSGGGGGSRIPKEDPNPGTQPTNAYKTVANVQMFVRIEDPNESALRLVTIDSNVVEISRTSLKSLGIEFGSAQVLGESGGDAILNPQGNVIGFNPITRTIDPTFVPGAIQAGNGVAGGGPFGFIDAFRARLNALYTKGNANILSKPNVTTLEGTEAQITIGGARPIPQVTSSGGGSGSIQENIVFRRFGVIVTMRPTLLSDNTIILQIRVDVTDLDPGTGITRGNTFIPGETVRSINNVLVLKEGDIIALGGLITNAKRRTTSRVPILSQIPILGALFQSRRFENNESELAIFLTPTIKRVPVPGSELEIGAIHPTGWPKLSGIDDGNGLGLGTVTTGQGTSGQ
ncbi:MAG TPA: pilus assembly protein N-terminal domain-containing protein [Abditibacteriaceae bacterium]